MPGSPRIDKGEGFIRSYELLEELLSDIHVAYETLERDRQSQYLRRCIVRAVFSFIEALVECIKVELRSAVRLGHFTGELTEREPETLGPLSVLAGPGKFLALDQNVKRTFKLAAKIWGLPAFRLTTSGTDFQDFLAAKRARNRLTHPRTFYDIEVTDSDMHCHTVAGMWMRAEFHRLFDARLEALVASIPEEDRPDFVAHLRASRSREKSDA